jgi:ribosome-associated protein
LRRETRRTFVLSERVEAAKPQVTPRNDTVAAPESDLLSLILTSLEDDKAEDVIDIPLTGKSEMADHMIVASGRSSRQVTAMAEHLADKLKQEAGVLARTEGRDTGDWVLIDCGDVIVHLFRPEVRDFYQLEKMWLSPEAQLERRNAGS